MKILANVDFKLIVKNTNLFAIDLIVKNSEGMVLLGLRTNHPAKNYWFVPGGRVHKNETLRNAMLRIAKVEANINPHEINSYNLIGLYDHIYDDNVFDDVSFNTHYIIAALELDISNGACLIKDSQHSDIRFESVNNILKDQDVHEFTKNYFLENPSNKFL